jgi:hypothetical protein
MRLDPKQLYAVISGDFIGFSSLPLKNRQAMYFILKNGGNALSEAFPGIMPCAVDMFRGDGWQMLLTNPVLSLRAALYFRAYIRSQTPRKKIDTRMAIAVGKIDYVPENRVSAGDGTAFRLSGKLLEKMNRTKSPTLRFAAEDKKKSLFLDRIVRQTGVLTDLWTPKQALAVMGVLRNWAHGQTSIAWPEPITSHTGKKLHHAGWPEIRHVLSVYEALVCSAISKS